MLSRLPVGQPVIRFVAPHPRRNGQQKDINSTIIAFVVEVLRETAAAGLLDRVTPGHGAPVEHFEDAVGDRSVDVDHHADLHRRSAEIEIHITHVHGPLLIVSVILHFWQTYTGLSICIRG